MFTLSKSITRILAGGLLTAMAAATSQPAAAATGDVSVEIDLTGGVTILYYQAALKVAIDTTGFVTTTSCASAGSGANTYFDCPTAAPATVTATVSGAGLVGASGSLNTTSTAGPLGSALTAVPLVLNNVWAVRALGGASANTTVQVALQAANKTLSAPSSGGTIVINGIDLGTGTGTVPASAPTTTTKTATFADPGLASTTAGYVVLNLDLSNAHASSSTGVAYTATGPQYVITITAT
jgi:hypothetical protein